MSMDRVDRKVFLELRRVIGNPKLKDGEFLEWSTSPMQPRPGETVVRFQDGPLAGVYCQVPDGAVKDRNAVVSIETEKESAP